jgi:signal transduction histidine kinase/CheY-like chemotaxis protein
VHRNRGQMSSQQAGEHNQGEMTIRSVFQQALRTPYRRITLTYCTAGVLATAIFIAAFYKPITTVQVFKTSEVYVYDMPVRVYLEVTTLVERSARYDLHERPRRDVEMALDELANTYRAMQQHPDTMAALQGSPGYQETLAQLGLFLESARTLVDHSDNGLQELREKAYALQAYTRKLAQQADALRAQERRLRFGNAQNFRNGIFWVLLGVLELFWLASGAFLWVRHARLIDARMHQKALAAEKDARDGRLEAELALHTFLGKISHEINSPLQTILTNIQLLDAAYAADDRFMKVVTRLKTSVTQLRTQILDLLDVSELKTGKLNIRLEALDLRKLVEDTVTGLQGNAEIKGLTLSLDIAKLPRVQADGRRIAQILTNLVNNAIRYTEKGGVEVYAHVSRTTGRPVLNLGVKDTGIGMTTEIQQQLFQPFMHGSGAKRKGTGLGLNIVKGLVEQLQGDIEFVSTVGRGTEFTVALPLLEVQPEALPVAKPQRAPVAEPSAKHQPSALKVLFADDEPGIREALTELMTTYGYDVITASSAAEARQALDEGEFALIILDMELGDGYGGDVAAYAQKTGNAAAPRVAMTAYPELYKQQAKELFQARLAKPVDAQILLRTLNGLDASAASPGSQLVH